MSNKIQDDYEIGYGKPPKKTQFQKGISGNPRGRPKKSLDFDRELIREANSFITINDNGRRSNISKHAGVLKQLINKALSGNIYAARIYLDRFRQAQERAALVAGPQQNSSGKYDVDSLSDEELMRIIVDGQKKSERESRKEHASHSE
jgi:hypothetical protein